ncbi:MAG: MBL fold metallo-hydrolase [Dermatophilaceae bacterium]|nr:MBL fold metallo-hydrolase [Actinomycetales bacterium]MBP8879867.1 MBL fold metallo-hydrolase [Dermatophilaceae bacterium]MBP9917162.1 MBL fold metallo-hydrolase [Dermatophilaceae bacterium]
MRLRHLGHSCLLVEVADRTILIDPGSWSSDFEDLSGLDAIVVTHQHADHLDRGRFAGLVRSNPDATIVTDPQSAALLADDGLTVTSWDDGVIQVGDVSLSAHGNEHAFNHSRVPQVANVGVRVSAAGEPVLFHPGDAYDAAPGMIDILAVPINAPWTAVRDSIDFVRRIAPRSIVPIHDGLLSPAGRGLYLQHIGTHGGDDLTIHDLAGQGSVRI